MCEHCGCASIAPIAQLMAVHEVLLDLSGSARRALRGGDGPAARAALTELAERLGPHTDAEERGLFAVFRQRGEFVEYVDRLHDDHTRMAARFAALPARPDWAERAPALLDELRQHIEAEEYGLFPEALATLDGAEWDAVSAAQGLLVR